MSGLPYRSKLGPYENEILELRKLRPPVPYREIVAFLKERYGVEITINGVFVFLKIRKKWSREAEKKTVSSGSLHQPSSGSREAITRLATTDAKPKPRFNYTPSDRYNLTRLTPEQIAAREKKPGKGD